MSQPTLFDRKTLRDKWLAFHCRNQHVGDLFERFALEALRTPGRIGAKAIWERMRWEFRVKTDEPKGAPQLNNSFTSFYARWFLERHPEHEGRIETRKQKATSI